MKLAWKHNGEQIKPHHDDLVINKISKHMSVLSIESVVARHAGEYMCMATNSAGTASQSAVLSVNGKLREAIDHASLFLLSSFPVLYKEQK